MTKFKYLRIRNVHGDYVCDTDEVRIEIAYQLKRIADKLGAKNNG